MSLPIIDTLQPLGDFPVAQSKDVSVNDDKRLNDVLDDYENRIASLEAGGSEGGGVEKDYNLIENKPSINNVELIGNKSLSELGIPADKSDIGLGNVDNTSDANKPVSAAVRAEIERIDGINNNFEKRITILEESGTPGSDLSTLRKEISDIKSDVSEVKSNMPSVVISSSEPTVNNCIWLKPYVASKVLTAMLELGNYTDDDYIAGIDNVDYGIKTQSELIQN